MSLALRVCSVGCREPRLQGQLGWAGGPGSPAAPRRRQCVGSLRRGHGPVAGLND